MNTIIVLGVSILVSILPLLEAIMMTAEDRDAEFRGLTAFRESVATSILYNLDKDEAMAILSEYIFYPEKMIQFADYLHNMGYPPQWSVTTKLRNYEYYEFLSFEAHLETLPFSMSAANRIIIELESKVFKNSPRIPNDIAYDMYMEKHLYKLLKFEDYYAIMVYLQDESQINLDNPAAWRMKRALYSLAIRQFNPNVNPSDIRTFCFYKEMEKRSYANSIEVGFEFKKSTFSICNSEARESYSYSSEYKVDKSFVWMSYEVKIMDAGAVVSLEDILDNHNGYVYVLFPEVRLKVLKGPQFWNYKYGKAASVRVVTKSIEDRSIWLAAVANQIEEYKEIERAYFANDD